MNRGYVHETVASLLTTAALSIEEAVQWLSEDLTVGENGVAEAMVHAENAINLALARLHKREEA